MNIDSRVAVIPLVFWLSATCSASARGADDGGALVATDAEATGTIVAPSDRRPPRPPASTPSGAPAAGDCKPNVNVTGWPAQVGDGNTRLNTFVIGDIGFSPGREAVTMSTSHLRILSTEGQLLASCPAPNAANNLPSLADLDHDGVLEIVFASSEGMQVVDDGEVQMIAPGWDGYSNRPLVLEDLDGDGEIEIIQIQDNNYGILHVRDRLGNDLPGWPVQPFESGDGHKIYHSSPVVGDLDGDGSMEVIIQLLRGTNPGPINDIAPTVFAFTFDGSELWSIEVPHDYVEFHPNSIDSGWFNDVVLGDVDADGHLEVVYLRFGRETALEANIVYVLDHLGGIQAEWHVPITEALMWGIHMQLALGDLDGDGDLEIATAAYTDPFEGAFVYAWHHDGTLVDGFRVRVPDDSDWVIAPTIADVDHDGSPDIVSSLHDQRNNFFNRVYAWDAAGGALACWPKALTRVWDRQIITLGIHSETTLADLDANGTLDLIAPIGSGEAHAIDLEVPTATAQMHWPMFRHDPQRTGRYEPPQGPCPADVDGDREVRFDDLIAVLAAWGNDGGPEDVDGSGTVDFNDLLAVLAAWGPCP